MEKPIHRPLWALLAAAMVENISIVNNYRSQFDRDISKSSYEELKKILKEKAE